MKGRRKREVKQRRGETLTNSKCDKERKVRVNLIFRNIQQRKNKNVKYTAKMNR